MDVSTVGAANSALYLQKAVTGLQAPLTPAKLQEQAASVIAQNAPPPPVSQQQIQQQQQQQQQQQLQADAARTVGRILDVEV